MTEDEVRDKAKILLGFNDNEENVRQGVGQITTFNQLGFLGETRRPDGWYLPFDYTKTAIIAEFKDSSIKLDRPKILKELNDNVSIALKKYDTVIGILWNGKDIILTLNNMRLDGTWSKLENKKYYIKHLIK